MPVLKTLVAADLKTAFRQQAFSAGMTESNLLRVVVLDALGHMAAPVLPPEGGKTETAQMTVRMPAFLLDTARARAAAQAMPTSRWVAALAQSNLLRDPVMTDTEIEVLRASNRELATIGRHLSQISRVMGDPLYKGRGPGLDVLQDLSDAIGVHRSAVGGLVRASQNVWGVIK